eukprot:COSAG02_NODE_410_length_22875_cov_43.282755_13_plen_68_part_00
MSGKMSGVAGGADRVQIQAPGSCQSQRRGSISLDYSGGASAEAPRVLERCLRICTGGTQNYSPQVMF